MPPIQWRHDLGRSRYSRGYVVLTKSNEWQAHWFPYVRDECGKERRRHRTKIIGSKAKMKRFQAEDELAKIVHPINSNCGKSDDMTLTAFIDHRWKPLHEGRWRKESTRSGNEYFLGFIRQRFLKTMLKDLDKVELQAWVNDLGKNHSQSVVLHVRTFLKSICAEAVEQEYLKKDPSVKLECPEGMRLTDKTVLTWDELRKVFAALSVRNRLIISIEGTTGLRPSELFALRNRSFTGTQLKITETIYRGKLRQYGKTPGSMTTVDLPSGLVEQIRAWVQPDRPEAFLFPNADGGFILKDNYLHRVIYPLREHKNGKGERAGIPGIKKLNFQILRRTFSTLAQQHGTVKDIQRQMRHSRPDITAEVYMQVIPESVQNMVSEMYRELMKPSTERVQ